MSTKASSTPATTHTNRRTLGEWLVIDGISYIPSTVLLTGIPKVSLKDNHSFAVLDTKGECPHIYHSELGFYYSDTRYLSNWEMTVNGQQLVYLSHELLAQGNCCVFSMTNRDFPSIDGKTRIQRDALLIRRVLTLYKDTVFEQLEFTNYDVIGQDLEIQVTANSGFEDIFEVRGFNRKARGETFQPQTDETGKIVSLEYRGLDGVTRRTFIQNMNTTPRVTFEKNAAELTYRLHVPAKGRMDIKTIIAFDKPNDGELFNEPFHEMTVSEHMQKIEAFSHNSYLGELKMRSDNQILDRALKNARVDIEMLTTFEKEQGLVYPYAGVPWYSAPFGRDGIIAAYQTLPWYPNLSIGVLDYCFRTIGTKIDAFTDEEPGKIFHEMRRGEMANLKEIPYIPYYGSVDSTPLALILLNEYVAWTHDIRRLKEWWPAARRCIEWMDKWGDPDSDEFLEYIKKSPTGLDNQGWKDSHNSVMYSDGVLATPPIELCEVQAYSYRARRSMAGLARMVGDHEMANRLTQQADLLKKKFTEVFWDEKERYIYLARDGSNRPCRVMSSNQGHCLWGQILDPAQGDSISRHLMSPRLFSGYGIRTLASDEIGYNPLSYHNGSIWPHDNSLIAEGMRFYKQTAHLQVLADALFDVVAVTSDNRFPELYCGFRRRNSEPPIPYEVACKPQAWSAGSMFLLMKSMLGFMMTPQQESIIFQSPILPSRVSSFEVKDVRVRDSEFDAVFYRGQNTCHVEITRRHGPLPILVVK